AADIYDASDILNPDTGLAIVLAIFSDAKSDGRETINGVDAVRVTGTVTAEAVNKIVPQISATGPVPGTAWIREDGNHDLVQAKLEPTPGNTVTMTCTDWGKPVAVNKPAV
ncbi:MAG: lipoprotein LprG, partial [Mycobacterium sp.]|nr:lipoprotein LprG [Mycobacterium sp.]